MAHTQSAKKRIRQTIARTAVNRSVMSRVRTLRKKVDAAVEGKDKEAAVAAYNNFASVIDKAAKRGTVPANRAANYNEPRDMRNALVAEGVPEDRIVCDYAGLRTLDSVVRAKQIFGADSLTIISQREHVERAVAIALRKQLVYT